MTPPRMLALALSALLPAATLATRPSDEPPAATHHLVVFEHGPRWPADASAPEAKTLAEHGAYVHGLFETGRALVGGPAPDRSCGILVLDVAERAEVERLLAADPAVRAGVLVPEVRAFAGSEREETWPLPALPAAPAGLEPIRKSVVVAAPLAEAWRAWSTPEGVETFFAPEVVLELAPLGAFEVRFFPDNPPGQRGAEGLRILSYVPERSLAFEWNAPPQFARARPERTFVVVELEPAGKDATRVTLLHQGFAEQAARQPELADEWRGVRAYFDQAWPSVLGLLEQRFAQGPVDWAARRAQQATR